MPAHWLQELNALEVQEAQKAQKAQKAQESSAPAEHRLRRALWVGQVMKTARTPDGVHDDRHVIISPPAVWPAAACVGPLRLVGDGPHADDSTAGSKSTTDDDRRLLDEDAECCGLVVVSERVWGRGRGSCRIFMSHLPCSFIKAPVLGRGGAGGKR